MIFSTAGIYGHDLPPSPPPLSPPEKGGSDIPPEISQSLHDWPLPNQNYSNTRTAADSPINSSNVNRLRIAWSFPLKPGQASSNPLILGNTVYFQDLNSNVYALDKMTGQVKWQKEYNRGNPGPNGPAAGWGKIFITAGTSRVAALDAATGEEVWSTGIDEAGPNRFTIQPLVYAETVFVSSTGGAGEPEVGDAGGRIGTIFALEQETGDLKWKLETVTGDLWGNPEINSGSGCYFPPAVDTDTGSMFWGTSNPAPFPGTEEFPNGSSRPGPNLYTNSLLSVDHQTGEMEWYHQVLPHDLFNLSLAVSPVLTSAEISGRQHDLVIGTGKVGRVYAFDRNTGDLLWTTALGRHENDQIAAVPEGETIRVYPGDLGGVETAMAAAGGVIYVASSDNYADVTSTTYTDADVSEGTGLMTAIQVETGRILWQKDLDTLNIGAATVINDLVFLGTLGGQFMALDRSTGEEVRVYESVPGINGWAAVSGDTIIALAGIDGSPALVAFKLEAK